MPLGDVSPNLGYALSNPRGSVRPSERAHCRHKGAIARLSCAHAGHDERSAGTWPTVLFSLLRGDGPQHLGVGVVGQSAHLVVRTVLDRVRHQDVRGGEAERGGLRCGGFRELAAGEEHTCQATAFEVGDVMHTA